VRTTADNEIVIKGTKKTVAVNVVSVPGLFFVPSVWPDFKRIENAGDMFASPSVQLEFVETIGDHVSSLC